MRWLLFFVALSASADCTTRVLLRTLSPTRIVSFDRGALYYALPGQSAVQRLDVSSGQTSEFFPLDQSIASWNIHVGTVTYTTSSAFVLIAPDGTRRELALPRANPYGIQYHDGYLYWFDSEYRLFRQSFNTAAIEDLGIIGGSGYAIFGDRLVFINPSGLYWKPLVGDAAPLQLLAPSNIYLDQITSEAIYVSTWTPFNFAFSSSESLRVPWTGGPPETIYNAVSYAEKPQVNVTATVRGGTTYIERRERDRFHYETLTLIVMHDGIQYERYGVPVQLGAWMIGADEDDVVIGVRDLGNGETFVRVCAGTPRRHATR